MQGIARSFGELHVKVVPHKDHEYGLSVAYPCLGWLEWDRMCLAAEGYSRAKYLKCGKTKNYVQLHSKAVI